MKPSFLEEIHLSQNSEKNLLCLHGLNQQPHALKPLLKKIGGMGFNTYLMHMPGHFGKEHGDLSPKAFLENYRASYDYLSGKTNKPLYFLGYSFGGLIGAHEFEKYPYEKMVLLAPALRVHGYSSLIQYVLPFIKKVVSVKFGNEEFEKKYRYHRDGVPSQIYSSFFKIYNSFQGLEKSNSTFANSKALVMMQSGDELVSYRKMKTLADNYKNWNFRKLNNDGAEFRRYKHLCFDSKSLGEKNFESMLFDIQKFFVKEPISFSAN